MTSNSARHADRLIEPVPPQDAVLARSLLGLANLPTVVAMGPFDDRYHAEQLAAAFTMVRRHCEAQLVLLGTGSQRTAVVRRTFAHGVGTNVHLLPDFPAGRRSHVIAAADVVVPSCRAGEVARRHPLQMRLHQPDEGNEYA